MISTNQPSPQSHRSTEKIGRHFCNRSQWKEAPNSEGATQTTLIIRKPYESEHSPSTSTCASTCHTLKQTMSNDPSPDKLMTLLTIHKESAQGIVHLWWWAHMTQPLNQPPVQCKHTIRQYQENITPSRQPLLHCSPPISPITSLMMRMKPTTLWAQDVKKYQQQQQMHVEFPHVQSITSWDSTSKMKQAFYP